MRAFFIDTIATVIFFTIIASAVEYFIAGMAATTVLTARLIMIPVMILTGRPYGIWRDQVFVRFAPKGVALTTIADIFAFLTFQVPVYVATLLIAGATLCEIQVAVSASILFMVVLSRPFGLFLEVLRKWANRAVP